jgi:AGCS family alanine or glycine:cation symporter
MFRLLFDGKSSESGVSSFKHYQCHWQVEWVREYCSSYSDCFGGPELYFDVDGCFFGASTAFVEATLAQIYKEKHLGEFRGGPAFYIERGLGVKWFAVLFAVVSIISAGVLLPGSSELCCRWNTECL